MFELVEGLLYIILYLIHTISYTTIIIILYTIHYYSSIIYYTLLILIYLPSSLSPSHPLIYSPLSIHLNLPDSFNTCRDLHILTYTLFPYHNLTPHKISEACLEWCSFICVVFELVWCWCFVLCGGVYIIIYYIIILLYIIYYYTIYYTLLLFHSSSFILLSSSLLFHPSSSQSYIPQSSHPLICYSLLPLQSWSILPSFILYLSGLTYAYLYSLLFHHLPIFSPRACLCRLFGFYSWWGWWRMVIDVLCVDGHWCWCWWDVLTLGVRFYYIIYYTLLFL
jgi:hypothetical protein